MPESSNNNTTQNNKRLRWTHNRSGLSGYFSVLTPEIMYDVPPALRASKSERLQAWEAYLNALDAIPENAVDAGFVQMYLPWNMLLFPPGNTGREKRTNNGHVGAILSEFHGASANPIRVAALVTRDENGEVVDVLFYMTNGNHSSKMFIERAYMNNPDAINDKGNAKLLPVVVTEVASEAEIAKAFVNINHRGVRRMDPKDVWRNMVAEQDPHAVYAVNLAAEYNIDARNTKHARGQNVMSNGAIVDKLIRGPLYGVALFNEAVARRTLELLSNPAHVGVYHVKDALKPQWVGALASLVALMERPGFIHAAGLRHMLSQPTFIQDALRQSKTVSVEDFANLFCLNVQRRSAGNDTREENARYLKLAAGMVKVYRTFVRPTQNTRGSGVYPNVWTDCPMPLRKLLWEAPQIASAPERDDFIAKMRRRLARTTNAALA